MATYNVYPLYGKDNSWQHVIGMSNQYILGISKTVDNIRDCRHSICESESNNVIINWKSYKYKIIIRGHESTWIKFKSGDFYKLFRFTSPCEDWEIRSKGYIENAIQL